MQIADPKVNRAGDTMTGPLTVNGELVAAAGYLRFSYSGGPGYIQWNGGGSYGLGGGGTIWHTGNLNPIQNGRLVAAGGYSPPGDDQAHEPYGGAILTGLIKSSTYTSGYWVNGGYWRYMQLLTPGGWFTVSYA